MKKFKRVNEEEIKHIKSGYRIQKFYMLDEEHENMEFAYVIVDNDNMMISSEYNFDVIELMEEINELHKDNIKEALSGFSFQYDIREDNEISLSELYNGESFNKFINILEAESKKSKSSHPIMCANNSFDIAGVLDLLHIAINETK